MKRIWLREGCEVMLPRRFVVMLIGKRNRHQIRLLDLEHLVDIGVTAGAELRRTGRGLPGVSPGNSTQNDIGPGLHHARVLIAPSARANYRDPDLSTRCLLIVCLLFDHCASTACSLLNDDFPGFPAEEKLKRMLQFIRSEPMRDDLL
jgi:hypothetical protein